MVLRQHHLLWKYKYLCELNKQQFILIGGGGACTGGTKRPPSGIRPLPLLHTCQLSAPAALAREITVFRIIK